MPILRLDMMQTRPPATAYTLLTMLTIILVMAAFFTGFTDAPIIAAVIRVVG